MGLRAKLPTATAVRAELRASFRALVPALKVGAVLVVLLNVVTYGYRTTFRPPGGAKTLAELHRAGEPVRRLVQVEKNGQVQYLWLGATRWLALPSGPACFVFNHRGELQQYSASTGDGELDELCDAALDQRPISLPDAIAATSRR